MEALAAAAGVFDIGVFKFETFLQIFFGVIDLCAVQINQAFRVDINARAVSFENQVVAVGFIDKFKVVRHPRAAAGFYTQAYAQAFAAFGEIVIDVFCGILGKGNHISSLLYRPGRIRSGGWFGRHCGTMPSEGLYLFS